MIIRCNQCETKFRFDEDLIREDGIWVRCSRCQYEFFQNHPSAPGPPWVGKGTVSHIPNIEIDRYPDISDVLTTRVGQEKEAQVEKVEEQEEKPLQKGTPRVLRTVLYILVSVILLASLGIWFIPDVRLQAMKLLLPYVPAIEGILGSEQPKKKSGLEGIQIQSVRQRFVTNVNVGNLRVIQGIVMNQSGVPLSRIKVKAELADPLDTMVVQKQSYSGNLLTDEELTVMSDEEIQRKLSNLQGTTISNDRVPPGGQIPFMIVVALEPPGITKTYVMIAGAERLLQ
jgi:predicted Zn finger-like uncharacterized protein